MIRARTLGTLQLSAASGLVLDGARFWVVADDLPLLHAYALGSAQPLQPLARVPLLAETTTAAETHLPKAAKPDLEALLRLPDDTLLALGSGSRPQRRRGFRVDPATRAVRLVDCAGLYQALQAELPALNVEGAAICGDTLWLAHRGNHAGGHDALVALDLAQALADLARGRLEAGALRALHAVELGTLGGTRLTLTDLAAHPDGTLWFCAAAEVTDDPYEDGLVRGSAIGRFEARGRVEWQAPVTPACKLEGLHWRGAAAGGDAWLAVADADDPAVPAPLLELQTAR